MQSVETPSTTAAIPAGPTTLPAMLRVPADPQGLVLFALSSGSSRNSLRNQRVASSLQDVGLATLLFNLLSVDEEPSDMFNAKVRFDIALLAQRLTEATRWAREQPELMGLPIGYFGAHNGAAAAMCAAAGEADIKAVVIRNGRPDLADEAIRKLRAPTLLIVGANDEAVAALNLEAWARLRCEKSIEIIPGAGHLFEEPGALDNVSALAARWFSEHLRKDWALVG